MTGDSVRDEVQCAWSMLSHAFVSLANRRALSAAIVFCAAFAIAVGRGEALGGPKPVVHDEFSYLLGAETFARGRLTNPPHAMSRHFETFHVLQRPTYTSKYPPANSLFIAAGWKFAGRPHVGVALSFAFMCASICWMLQVWLGGALGLALASAFTLRIAGSYWAVSYWGGAVAAGAGALVMGAAYRLLPDQSEQAARSRVLCAIVLAVGLLLLANSRPYEGLWFALPLMLVLGWRLFRDRTASPRTRLLTIGLPFAIVMSLGGGGMLAYNRAVTGSPLLMPYAAYQANDPTPLFLWQTPAAPLPSADAQLRAFAAQSDTIYRDARTVRGRIGFLAEALSILVFAIPPVVVLPLLLLPLTLARPASQFALAVIATTVLGMSFTSYYFHHYAAPMVGAILVMYGECLRVLKRLQLGEQLVGRPFAAAVLALWSCMGLGHIAVQILRPDAEERKVWPAHRQAIADSLTRGSRRNVVFVRYAATHPVESEWVYNAADVDASPVVWARDLGTQANRELLAYYQNRTAWSVDVVSDDGPFTLRPYVATERE